MDLLGKLKKINSRYEDINEQLSDSEIVSDRNKMISLSKERSDLDEIINVYQKYDSVLKNISGNKEIISSENDKELIELAEAELGELYEKKEKLEEKIKFILLPKDPNDDKDVIVEIRAGTGGDEAGLFAGDLFRMYSRYSELKSWKLEIIDISESGMGGIKEVVFSLNGDVAAAVRDHGRRHAGTPEDRIDPWHDGRYPGISSGAARGSNRCFARTSGVHR